MQRNRVLALAAAAGLALGGVGFAQQDTGGAAQPGQQGSSGQSSAQQGQQSSGAQSEMSGGGQQADQQISQQLEQIKQDPNTAADKLFVLMASLHNQAEIELSKRAQEKAKDEQVKQIAQKMEQDHNQANQQLQQAAQQLGLQLPQSLPKMKQEQIEIMAALPDDQFDKHYIAHLQAAHAMDLSKYAAVSQLSQNDQVKQYVQQQLPILLQHHQSVQQSAQALGLPGGGGSEAVPAGGRMPGDTQSDQQRSTPGQSAPGSSGSGATGGGTSGSGLGSGTGGPGATGAGSGSGATGASGTGATGGGSGTSGQ